MQTNKKTLMAIFLAATLITVFAAGYFIRDKTINVNGSVGLSSGIDNPTNSEEITSVHCRIKMFQGTALVMDQYHAGVVTDFGDNATLAKLFGDPTYNLTMYSQNATYISRNSST